MASVNDKFALALKSRLDGQAAEAFRDGPLDSPARNLRGFACVHSLRLPCCGPEQRLS